MEKLSDTVDRHYQAAQALFKQRRFEEAAKELALAIQLDPTRIDCLFSLGCILLQRGQIDKALACFQQALKFKPEDANLLSHQEMALASFAKPHEAILHLRRAVELAPQNPLVQLRIAIGYTQLQNPQKAKEHYQKALAIDPGLPEANWGMGSLAFQAGSLLEAIDFYLKAIQSNPQYAECHKSLGNVLFSCQKFAAAAECFEKAIEIRPSYTNAWCDLGVCLIQLGKLESAEHALKTALEQDPNLLEAIYNFGNLKRLQLQPKQAIPFYQKIIRSASTADLSRFKRSEAEILALSRNAKNNLALCYGEIGWGTQAIECYREALAEEPDNPRLHTNYAYSLLSQGFLREGWIEHEWRWKMPNFPTKTREWKCPLWQGEALQGHSILLHAEQGFGDTIQFVRYATLVADLGAKVYLEAQPSLCRLLDSVQGITKVIPAGEPLPQTDWHSPLMSLPLRFQSELHSIPNQEAYLRVEQADKESLQKQWASNNLRIGIAWSGNPANPIHSFRTIKLKEFISLAEIPQLSFYSLQVGEAVKEITDLPRCFEIQDVCSEYRNFYDTAAFVSGLDLIITADTSVAHLAGALGRPVWILLSHLRADWRWFNMEGATPWYPNARIFRQKTEGDWSEVISRVKQAINDLRQKQNNLSNS